MVTEAQAKRDRKQLRAELETELRKKDRKRLAAMRAAIREARTAKRARLASVRDMCRAERIAARERAQAARAALSVAIKAERLEVRGACSTNRERVRSEGKQRIESAAGELSAERETKRVERLYQKAPKLGASSKSAGGRRSSELQAESDDEVRNNLPPELVPVFDSVRRSIVAGPRRTRTERFLEWAQEHPQQVLAITERQIAADLARLEREEREHAKAMRKPARYRRSTHELEQSLADVPF